MIHGEVPHDSGVCVGGPLDGTPLVSHASYLTFEVREPLPPPLAGDEPFDPSAEAELKFADAGRYWWEHATRTWKWKAAE